MEFSSSIVKHSLASYLANLPLPNSFLGWFKLGVKDWVQLVPFFTVVGGISFVTYRSVVSKSLVNPDTKKDVPKVVDIFDVEDLGESTAFCRCWRSSKFPYCDGAHNSYNISACDNVGPVIVKKK